MFEVFGYPVYEYGYRHEPVLFRPQPMLRRRRPPFESYIQNLQRKLARFLYEEMLEDQIDQEPAEGGEEQKQSPHEGEEVQQKQENENEKREAPERQGVFFRSSFVRSRLGGEGSIVEEHRERVTSGDGSVHVVTRRQIGDRWYVHESHSTKDGESSSKETWHNVPEDQVQSFKDEWEQKLSLKQDSEVQSIEDTKEPQE